MSMTVGSLFAGIGGFDLGFERAGFDVRWQVEINGFCRAVLRKHWPHVRRYADVRRVGVHNLESVDVVCGGFPCQGLSVAGARAGFADARSGLWSEYARIIRELRPRYAVLENVPGLLAWGLGRVLGDLAEIGHDAEWDCLPASAAGAAHVRDRVWIVSYPRRVCQHGLQPQCECRCSDPVVFGRSGATWRAPWASSRFPAPRVDRAGDGLPNRVDRCRGLGNAIVPQIAQWIAERIKEAEQLTDRTEQTDGRLRAE
jgi:DNA (cytosine-5)-methyltransferase 1